MNHPESIYSIVSHTDDRFCTVSPFRSARLGGNSCWALSTDVSRGNPVTAERAHNFGAISAPPHISAPETGTVSLFRGVLETWRTSWRTIRFHYGAGVWLLSLLRPLRVLAYREAHRKLLALPVYKQFGATMLRQDPFHHLSHGRYLRQGLTVRQRIEYVYQHYAFESRQWTDDYRRAVYGGPGLELWRSPGGGAVVTIRLGAGKPDVPEGDLSIVLSVDNAPLHRISFSWLADTQDGTVTPFLASSQTWPRSRNTDALFAFQRDFPQNSPAFFCFAAVEGVARVVGCTAILAVRGHEQICARKGRGAHFKSSYDNFWRALGGSDCGRQGFLISLPTHQKPLNKRSSSHRRRAQRRRRHWKAIEAATVETLEPFLSGISSSTDEGHYARVATR
jgi:uncharacterized protein VirK/YbjX